MSDREPSEHLSNFHLDVLATSKENLDRAIRIAFSANQRATHYIEENGKLWLLWHEQPNASRLPFALGPETAPTFVLEWLRQQQVTEPEPDIDGHCKPIGWRIRADNAANYAVLSVERVWAEYHK